MIAPPDTLPTDTEALQRLVIRQREELSVHRELLDTRDGEIARLTELLALMRARRFGRSSEKLAALGLQGRLFDESELQTEIAAMEAELERAKADRNKRREGERKRRAENTDPADRPRRKPLPEHLRRVEIEVDLCDEDLQMMGDDWVFIGYETSEQLAVNEREYYIKRFKRRKYVRRDKAAPTAAPVAAPVAAPTAAPTAAPAAAPAAAPTTAPTSSTTLTRPGSMPNDLAATALALAGIKIAPPMPVILPRAIADASLLAKLLAAKFIDAMSFNRELKVLQREGIELSYTTLCSYPIQLAERLEPMRELLYEQAATASRWHLDETTLQVLQEPGRAAEQKSYLWGLRAGLPGQELVLFHYAPGRDYDTLKAWLDEPLARFDGVIVTDEYRPYQQLSDEYAGIQARGGCWAHVRRKAVEALKGRRHASDAQHMIKAIAMLYELESRCADLSGEAKLAERRRLIGPWVETFYGWLEEIAPSYLSKGLMRTAIRYALNARVSLTAFLDHAELPIDNNPMENAIRPFTVGRRNWLYAGSPRGANASAFIYSLVESAKGCGLEPKAYLQALFERYPFARTTEERRALLPMFINMDRSAG